MHPLQADLLGRDGLVLVVRLPEMMADNALRPLRDAVDQRLPDCDGAAVVLDLSAVRLMNSIGITALLEVQDLCRSRRAGFLLAAVPEPIRAFLATLKLDRRFPSRPSVDEAVAELDAS